MAKLKKDRNNYSEAAVKSNRTFPIKNTVFLVILAVIQIGLVCIAVFYEPSPQDSIKKYTVTAEPLDNGTVDIEYNFLWRALDTSEDLTWVEIGIANPNYTVYDSSLSANIKSYERISEDGYVALVLNLDRAYEGGETLEFSFKINQSDLLCKDDDGYFYEFIPGWFNSTPVEEYEFKWKQNENCISADNALSEDGYYVRNGRLDCGGYEKMYVRYDSDAFDGNSTVEYEPFDDSGAYNELEDARIGTIIMVCILIALIIVAEVYIVDSYVSYNRGRGFLTGYGHRVHIYGRTNPRYIKERDKHNSRGRGHGGGGGGCACACACACAGGGRAGCSQKDTYNKNS